MSKLNLCFVLALPILDCNYENKTRTVHRLVNLLTHNILESSQLVVVASGNRWVNMKLVQTEMFSQQQVVSHLKRVQAPLKHSVNTLAYAFTLTSHVWQSC